MAPYSPRIAFDDLVEGALRGRRPARKHAPDGIGLGWQLGLAALAGLAGSVDALVRERVLSSDLPDGMAWLLPFLNGVLLPILTFVVGILAYAIGTGGSWIVLRRRMPLRLIGSAVALGLWAAMLPTLAAILLALAVNWSSEAITVLVGVIQIVHVVPSLAETGDLTIGRAFLAYLFGPLVAILVVLVAVVLGGFLFKGGAA